MHLISVLRSGPVRFFSFLRRNRNRNRLPNMLKPKKPDRNRKKPQKTAKNRFELTFRKVQFELTITGFN